MSEVKRFHIWHDETGCHVRQDPEGNSVNASDFDIEHALRIEAERQVGELREQSDWRGEMAANNCREYEKQLVISHGLQAKLDTAMGLLRELEAGTGTSPGANKRWAKVRKFINTASTEGKDHDPTDH